uniref:WGS project CAEQ00000000 data, annotated contig 1060 n=1 Tax=Trypanosoma congolense (strain IL3000) TaxID=1068625 RepID=F9W3J5_TRYCI|nr:unnamed protein product [Trypanosoma congolense IL3000]
MRRMVSHCRPRFLTRLCSQVSESKIYSNGDSPKISTRVLPFRHRKLYSITLRELHEESLRDFLPPKPAIPAGWTIEHQVGSSRFDLRKVHKADGCTEEDLHVVALMESKKYEETYRMDNGEREEEDYIFFTLFIKKSNCNGGLEFGLTSIDMELVMDTLVVHSSDREIDSSVCSVAPSFRIGTNGGSSATNNIGHRRCRDYLYRGPMLNELDDDFTDEILDYLDERGINNGFAEYVMAQAHYFEQEEYLNWLHLLKVFAK